MMSPKIWMGLAQSRNTILTTVFTITLTYVDCIAKNVIMITRMAFGPASVLNSLSEEAEVLWPYRRNHGIPLKSIILMLLPIS